MKENTKVKAPKVQIVRRKGEKEKFTMTIDFDMDHIADYLHETAQERLQNHSHEEHMAEVLHNMNEM